MLAFALLPAAGPLHLPLSGSTAECLIAALLTDDESARLEQLASALARDAAWALWATLAADRRGMPPMRTCAAIGRWLAAALPDELIWPSPAKVDAPPLSAARRKQYAALAAASFGTAAAAAQIARSRRLDVEAAEWLGLLSLAPQWLALASQSLSENRNTEGDSPILLRKIGTVPVDFRIGSKSERTSPGDCASLLPAWLADALSDVAGADENDSRSLPACIALAQRFSNSPGRSAASIPGLKLDRRRHNAAVDEVKRQWPAFSPAAAWLPALAERLRQLHSLRTEFDRRLETEKLESLKELAQGAGHEINNPLANISARAQTLLHDERDPERRRLLASINTQAFRAHEMITDMMLFARPPQLRRAPTDVGNLLQTVAAQFEPRAVDQHAKLRCEVPDTPMIADVDATQLHEVLAAMVTNSLEALVTGGTIDLSVTLASGSPGLVQITVSDSGPGISAEVRRHLFDPFYSGREAGRGIGFGLSKCWRIVRLHGGRIEAESPPQGGASFRILLPSSSADSSTA